MANNEIDGAIQTLLKLGVRVTKLWENASPTSAFPEQTLKIPWQDYDFIKISFPETGAVIVPTKTTTSIFRANAIGGLGSSSGYAWVGYRHIKLVANGITIPAMSLIPTIIHGIKLLGVQLKAYLRRIRSVLQRGCRICLAC